MVQIPESSHQFDNDNRTDGNPDYYVKTRDRVWHLEPWLLCMIVWGWFNKGRMNNWLPLWRMNGAGENDPKIPVILAPGMFSNRFGMDYNKDGEIYSLARFLANRGRDVWIIEFQQSLDKSSRSYWDFLVEYDLDYRDWYWEYLMTDDQATYESWDAHFNAQGICDSMPYIVMTGDTFTATVDDLALEDVPAIVSAILAITNQTKIQWVGHSLGAVAMLGFLPTEYITNGRTNAGFIEGDDWKNLPTNSVLSVTSIAGMGALFDAPQWLWDLYNSGQMTQGWIYRSKLPRYFRYLQQQEPRCPVKLQGIIDTAQLAHLSQALTDGNFPFFPSAAPPHRFYYELYNGSSFDLSLGVEEEKTLTGHSVITPITWVYDGNGYDLLCTLANISPIFSRLQGYTCLKPFYIYKQAETSHVEMINGYIFEEGDPGWPPHLQYDYGGTYHYIWYDLNRYLPPAIFEAFAPTPETAADPFITWVNQKDTVEYEIWAKTGAGGFIKKVDNINQVRSGADCAGLTPGTWKIKVRAVAVGGEWQDHSGENSIGETDDEAKYLTVVKG